MSFKPPTLKDIAKLVETCDKHPRGSLLAVLVIIAFGVATAIGRVSFHL